jgi:hypothetical protein
MSVDYTSTTMEYRQGRIYKVIERRLTRQQVQHDAALLGHLSIAFSE